MLATNIAKKLYRQIYLESIQDICRKHKQQIYVVVLAKELNLISYS